MNLSDQTSSAFHATSDFPSNQLLQQHYHHQLNLAATHSNTHADNTLSNTIRPQRLPFHEVTLNNTINVPKQNSLDVKNNHLLQGIKDKLSILQHAKHDIENRVDPGMTLQPSRQYAH